MDGWMETYGNVKAQSSYLVSDGRGSNAPHTSTDSFTITGYEPAIKSITDYYPFGMQMPDRCYSDGTTHTTNISAVITVPVHHMVNRVWPDGRDSSIGGAIILTGSSPLGLVASGLEALSYELPRYIGGLLHTVRIFTHGTVPPGFRAEISMGGTSSSTTSFSGISTDLTYTPTSISVPYLHIYNLGMRDTIFIDSVHIDSATYEPYHVLSSISSSDGYAYGFNGQMKVNEWAGSGNHTTALFWEYDVRTGKRANLDPVNDPSISPYSAFKNSPILFSDPNGRDTFNFNHQTSSRSISHSGMDNFPSQKILQENSSLKISVGEGSHVFYYNNSTVEYDDDGNVTNSTSKHTRFFPLYDDKGFRTSEYNTIWLAQMTPTYVLQAYASQGAGLDQFSAALVMQKDLKLYGALDKVVNVGYALEGGYFGIKAFSSYLRINNIVNAARAGEGMYGLGTGSYSEAMIAGRKFVGDRFRVSSRNSSIWISEDGLRQFRPPSNKPNLGKIQSNFQSRPIPKGEFINNGHLEIK